MRLSKTEKQIMLDALEAFIRVHLGQVHRVFEQPILVGLHDEYSDEHREAAKGYADRLEDMLRNGDPPSIRSPLVADVARQAYRLKARIEGDKMQESLFTSDGHLTESAQWVEDSMHGKVTE